MTTKFMHDLLVGEEAVFEAEVANGNGGAAKMIDWTAGNKQAVSLTADCTFTFTPPEGACNLVLRIAQDGTGGWEATWPATCKWPDAGALPVLTADPGAVDLVTFYFDGTNYYGAAILDFAAPPA